ncbi:hypothetical protein OE88DRAFT_1732894 [Heliocybe sulcata]|uniref:DUF3533 domain-containing protein n=1 Tax=Heliocybe sulcata TaxID=5364 RepID=A0A5C3NB06_9AGAM|nr:hypothetical protein OE88DRAFT_1732894 [Heliocybe sulcata]
MHEPDQESTRPSEEANASRQTVVEDLGQPEGTHADSVPPGPPFSKGFWDKDPDTTKARQTYLKVCVLAVVLVSLTIWAVLPMFWGSEWKPETAIHNLNGWIIDFDGGEIGSYVSQNIYSLSGPKEQISWHMMPASNFPNGPSDVPQHILQEDAWVIVSINPGATNALNSAAESADASYNGSYAVTMYASEARNENSYRLIMMPMMDMTLRNISSYFATRYATQLAGSGINLVNLLTNAPQVVTSPISYTTDNVRPFDVEVASAVDFVGLIYLLILAFITVLMNFTARVMVSGLDRRLRLSSLIKLRLAVPPSLYFPISLNYALVSLAFQVPFNRQFGRGGFVIFWMLAWVGMTALGLAVEALVTILTPKFIPFFLVLWLIANVSVSFYPIELLPTIFRYGYAAPFYNVSRAVRTLVFRTRNQVGLNFGVLFAWIAISCITIPLFQWFMRRKAVMEYRKQQQKGEKQA